MRTSGQKHPLLDSRNTHYKAAFVLRVLIVDHQHHLPAQHCFVAQHIQRNRVGQAL